MSDDHTGVLLEDIQDKLIRVLEATAALSGVPADIKDVVRRLEIVESQTALIPAI